MIFSSNSYTREQPERVLGVPGDHTTSRVRVGAANADADSPGQPRAAAPGTCHETELAEGAWPRAELAWAGAGLPAVLEKMAQECLLLPAVRGGAGGGA